MTFLSVYTTIRRILWPHQKVVASVKDFSKNHTYFLFFFNLTEYSKSLTSQACEICYLICGLVWVAVALHQTECPQKSIVLDLTLV